MFKKLFAAVVAQQGIKKPALPGKMMGSPPLMQANPGLPNKGASIGKPMFPTLAAGGAGKLAVAAKSKKKFTSLRGLGQFAMKQKNWFSGV